MSQDLLHASTIESVRFTAQIGVPNVISGLFRKRGPVVAVTSRVGVDSAAYALMEGLVRSYGPEPFWVKVAGVDSVVVHHPDDIRLVLEGSPEQFASDPDTKRKGMRAFQPDALTISRGDVWRQRRDFAEAVLDTGSSTHRLSHAFTTLAAAEAAPLIAARSIGYDAFHDACLRLTRRVIFGDAAADDTSITDLLADLMSAGNSMPDEPAGGYDDLVARIQGYLDVAEEGSLASLVAQEEAPPGGAAGQLVHWMFAMGDTLALNAFRALVALAAHPQVFAQVREAVVDADLDDPASVTGLELLGGCLFEAMRLWPTTPMFGRVSLTETRFSRGQVVPAGTQYLILNLFNHRNRDRIPYADRFVPAVWVEGDAADDWSFNFFSHGPQGCPGVGLSMLLGQALLARIVAASSRLILDGADLDAAKRLPHMLDASRVRVTLP